MNKKFQLKGGAASKPADGTENNEHILDIISHAKMKYSNIQDNFDIALKMYKLNKSGDEDILDAIQLNCENLAVIESEASGLIGEIENYNEKNETHLKTLYSRLAVLENQSNLLLNRILEQN